MLTFIAASLAGFVLLVWGADRFVVGAGATARNLGVAPLFIGLTIVGFATSAPEILVSAVASLDGTPSLAIGNALGSNIANIALVLGITAMLRPLTVNSATLRRELPALLAVTLLTLMLFLDGFISRVDGFVLMAGLGLLMYWIVTLGLRSQAEDPIRAEFEAEIRADLTMTVAIAWFVVGLVVLLLGSNLLVWGATSIAHQLDVSALMIGLTVVAVGTSLPELAVSIVSAMKGEHGLAIGNIIGSNMFNLLAVVGVAGIILPTGFEASVLSLHFPVMIGLTLVLFAMGYNVNGPGRINRLEGTALFMGYVAYFAYVIYEAI